MSVIKSITDKTKELFNIPDKEKLSIQVIENMTTQELLTKYKEIVEERSVRKSNQIAALKKSKYQLAFALISLFPVAIIGYSVWWKVIICGVCILLFINFLVKSIQYTSKHNALQKNEDNFKFELTAVQFHLDQRELKNQRTVKETIQSPDEATSQVDEEQDYQ